MKKKNLAAACMLAAAITMSFDCFSQTVLIEQTDPAVACTKPPGKPGAISGPKTNLCGLPSITLSINPVTNATSYTWTVPSGFTILQDNGTSILLGLPATFGQVTITVTANNDCGSSLPQRTNIFANPSRITGVTGPTCVLPNESGLVYSVVNPEAGVTYTWYPPGAARITSGQGTSTVTVTWRDTSGVLGLRPFNACGMNARFNYYVTVNCSQAVKASAPVSSGISVSPNPAISLANISFNTSKGGNYTIKISDMNGKQVCMKQGAASAGSNSVSLDVSSYKQGMYIVTLVTDEGTQVTKMMK